jgi:hypothetical protein
MSIQVRANDNSIHQFPDGTDPRVVQSALSRYNSGLKSVPSSQMAQQFDGLCQMPDGAIHPYTNIGGDYVNTFDSGPPRAPGQIGLAAGVANASAPVLPKRGGIGGGGPSGPVTSPLAKTGRDLTGWKRLGILQPLTGRASIGSALSRVLPAWAGILGYLDFQDYLSAPYCRPLKFAQDEEDSR